MFAGKKRFVTKITGLSRANFLAHAFEDYQVVWIDRDPRAVVCSMMKQRWFFKRKAEKFNAMTNTELIEFYCNYYNKIWKSKNEIPAEKLISVYYEDLVENPIRFFEKLLPKINLKMNHKFNERLKKWKISPVNIKNYKTQFTEYEWELLNLNLKEALAYSEKKDYFSRENWIRRIEKIVSEV